MPRKPTDIQPHRDYGFFGPDSYYINDAANRAYAERAVNGARLDMPVLFIAGRR